MGRRSAAREPLVVRFRRRLVHGLGGLRPGRARREGDAAPGSPRAGPAPRRHFASAGGNVPEPEIDLTSDARTAQSQSDERLSVEFDWVRAPDATRARLSPNLEAEYWRVAGTNLWTWEVLEGSQLAEGRDRRDAIWQGIATSEDAAQQAVRAWHEAYQASPRLPS